jgi:hypothetical protein
LYALAYRRFGQADGSPDAGVGRSAILLQLLDDGLGRGVEHDAVAPRVAASVAVLGSHDAILSTSLPDGKRIRVMRKEILRNPSSAPAETVERDRLTARVGTSFRRTPPADPP